MKLWLALVVVLILVCACAFLASMRDRCPSGHMRYCPDNEPCECLSSGMALPGVP